MTKRTLFLGDSHCAGFYENADGTCTIWDSENNYPEIYSKLYNVPSAIYAMPGACNRHYPVWFSFLTDQYNTDTAFIQSTYWNRYLVGFSEDLDWGDGLTKDHFVDKSQSETHRYSSLFFNDRRFEMMVGQFQELFEPFKGFSWSLDDPESHYQIFNENYKYTKLWFEGLTHLQLRDYLSDLIVVDHLAQEKDIDVHVWNINKQVHIPGTRDLFGKFKRVKFAQQSAEEFLYSEHNMKIENMKIDKEHYHRDVHNAIAKFYIPYLEKNSK